MLDNNIYKDDKGRPYQLMCSCIDMDSEKERVVYQALYGEYKYYVRDKDSFFEFYSIKTDNNVESEADTGTAKQETVKVDVAEEKESRDKDCNKKREYPDAKKSDSKDCSGKKEEQETKLEPLLEHFLESSTYADKKKVLKDRFEEISQRDLDNIYAALDIATFEGDIKAQTEGLMRYLSMQEHYVGSRLRN